MLEFKELKMKVVQTQIVVGEHGRASLQLPPDIVPGEHHVVIVLEENTDDQVRTRLLDFPIDSFGLWPRNLSLRREDLYHDWGR